MNVGFIGLGKMDLPTIRESAKIFSLPCQPGNALGVLLAIGIKFIGEAEMKKSAIILMMATFVMAVGAGSVFAGTNDPVIQQREINQENRIEQGVRSGELTPREAGRLDAQQARIQQDEARMKADGNLTPRERAKLAREQNRASRNIYRKKHNARKADVK